MDSEPAIVNDLASPSLETDDARVRQYDPITSVRPNKRPTEQRDGPARCDDARENAVLDGSILEVQYCAEIKANTKAIAREAAAATHLSCRAVVQRQTDVPGVLDDAVAHPYCRSDPRKHARPRVPVHRRVLEAHSAIIDEHSVEATVKHL